MAKDSDGSYVQVYDGRNHRNVLKYIATDLDTGRVYRFKVSAYNLNGEGPMSPELITYSCIAPSRIDAPTRVTSTLTSITLQWNQPTDNGGCPILGYAVFRNNGENGEINTEVNTDYDTNVRDKPTLRQMVVTNLPANSVGKSISF